MTGIVNVTLSPAAWARRATDDLIELAQRFDRSSVTSLLLADPDEIDGLGPWRWDSSTGVGALLAVTERLGLVISVASSYTDPFSAARRVGSLDNLSGGRVGWLVTPRRTASLDQRTRSISPDRGVDDRFERATELITASRALWDSWDEGALQIDVANNVIVDTDRVHAVDFEGRHFRVAGPINLRRPPSGNPATYVRVTDCHDVQLAARSADVALVASVELASRVREAVAGNGRTQPITVLLSVTVAPDLAPHVLADLASASELDGIDLVLDASETVDGIWPMIASSAWISDPSFDDDLRAALSLPLLRS